jgi:hypothetical protein
MGSCSKVFNGTTVDAGADYLARRRNSPACWALVFRCAFWNCSSEAVRISDGVPLTLVSGPFVLEGSSCAGTAFTSLLASLPTAAFPSSLLESGGTISRQWWSNQRNAPTQSYAGDQGGEGVARPSAPKVWNRLATKRPTKGGPVHVQECGHVLPALAAVDQLRRGGREERANLYITPSSRRTERPRQSPRKETTLVYFGTL